MPTVNFAYTGAEVNWTVPTGVGYIDVDLAAGEGGGGLIGQVGGKGGRITARINVIPGDVLRIGVGGKGADANGASASPATFYQGGATAGNGAGAGGGQTYLKRGGATDSNRILVAGGGGGASGDASSGVDGQPGGITLGVSTPYTEADAQRAGQNGANRGGGGGGGWWGGSGSTGNTAGGHGARNMAHSTQTKNIVTFQDSQVGNGYASISYTSPSVVNVPYTQPEELWTVPAGVTEILVEATGAEGGNDTVDATTSPGLGGIVIANLAVTPGEVLRLRVGVQGQVGGAGTGGAGGFYGGAASGAVAGARGGGGGGATDIRRGTTDADRIIVAGGGGGASGYATGNGTHGGLTTHTEATASVAATAGATDGARGGGGGGWRGGIGAGNPGATAAGGSNFYRTTAVLGTPYSVGGNRLGDGYLTINYVPPPGLQRAAVLYPVNSPVVDTSASIDIRALTETAPITTDISQSIRNALENTTSDRTFDPATSQSAVARTASTLHRLGWAVPLTNMPATDARCSVILRAQTCTVALNGSWGGTGTGVVNDPDSFTPRVSLWKYNPATDVGTLIVQNLGTNVTHTAVVDYASDAWSSSVTLAVPETTFADGEVLFAQIGGTLRCGAGTLGANRATTMALYLNNNTKLTFSGAADASQNGLRQKCACAAAAGLDLTAAHKRVRIKKFTTGLTLQGVYRRGPLGWRKTFTGGVALSGAVKPKVRLMKAGGLTLTGRLRLNVPQAALNRVAAGGRRIIRIFED